MSSLIFENLKMKWQKNVLNFSLVQSKTDFGNVPIFKNHKKSANSLHPTDHALMMSTNNQRERKVFTQQHVGFFVKIQDHHEN